MTTLAALVSAYDLSMYMCGENELTRCWQRIDKIRLKHASKPKFDGTDGPFSSDMPRCGCGNGLLTDEQLKSGHCAECVRIRS